MRTKFGVLLVGISLLCMGRPLVAHHSFSSEYDEKKPVSISGSVSKVEWTNPHVRIYVDAKDSSGKVTTWNMELATPSALTRNGWTSRSLKVGDEVTIKGFAAKNESPRASAGAVTLADGRSLFAGAAPGTDPGAAPAQ
jgi:hypothetical protein